MNELSKVYGLLKENSSGNDYTDGVSEADFLDYWTGRKESAGQLFKFIQSKGLADGVDEDAFIEAYFTEKKSPSGSGSSLESSDSSSNLQPVPDVDTPTSKVTPWIDPIKLIQDNENLIKADPKEEPKTRNPIKTFFKAAWGTASKQIPSAFSAAFSATAPDQLMIPGQVGLIGAHQIRKSVEESTGEDYYEYMDDVMTDVRKDALKWAVDKSKEGQEYMKDLVQKSDDISDPIDALNYVAFQVGNTTPQIAVALIPGFGQAGAAGQEIGSIYMDEVRKISEKTGLSQEEVIQRGLDDRATAVAFGTMAGMLERMGAVSIFKGMKKEVVDKALRQRALSLAKTRVGKVARAMVTEGTTEGLQTIIEEVGSALGSDTPIDIKSKDVFEAVLAGATGGGGLTTIGQFTDAMIQSRESKSDEKKDSTIAQEPEPTTNSEVDKDKIKKVVDIERAYAEDIKIEEGKVIEKDGVELTVSEIKEDESGQVAVAEDKDGNVVELPMEEITSEAEAKRSAALEGIELSEAESNLANEVAAIPVDNRVDLDTDISATIDGKSENLPVSERLINNEKITIRDFTNDLIENGTKEEIAIGEVYQAIFKDGLDQEIQPTDRFDEGVLETNINEETGKRDQPTRIKYSQNVDRIQEKFGLTEAEAKKKVIMHELGHHATIEGLFKGEQDSKNNIDSAQSRLFGRVTESLEKAREAFSDEKFIEKMKEKGIDVNSNRRGLEGAAEFATEALNNPEFREALNNIDSDNTIVQRIIQAIKGYLTDLSVRKDSLAEKAIVEVVEAMTFFTTGPTKGSVQNSESNVNAKFEQEDVRLTPERVRVQEFLNAHVSQFSKDDLLSVIGENTSLSMDEISNMYDVAAIGPLNSSANPSIVTRMWEGSWLQDVHKKWLSAKRGLPANVVKFRELMNGTVMSQTEKARNIGRAIDRQIKKDKVRPDQLTDYLTSEDVRNGDHGLSDKMVSLLDAARLQIDSISKTLIREGYVEGKAAESVAQNIGVYLNRSYEIFTNKKYKPTEEVKRKAKAFIKEQYREKLREMYEFNASDPSEAGFEAFIDRKAETKVNDLLSKPQQKFQGPKTTGSKDTNLLKQKNDDLPKPIRDLYGEITDPVQVYVNTVYRATNLLETNRFLHNIRQLGEGRFFFRENDIRRPSDHNFRIAGETSPTMFPLNGMYTTKEIYDGLKEMESSQEGFYKILMQVNGMVNWSKTVGSYVTHARNVIGNIPFMVSNFYNPMEIRKALQGIAMDSGFGYKNRLGVPVKRSKREKAIADIVTKLKDGGVIGQNVALGIVKDTLGATDVSNAVFKRMSGRKRTISEKVISTGVWIKNGLDRLYSAEDDVFKIISFLNEANRYSKAIYGKSYKNLTDSQQLQVDQIAMEITKNVLPNYSKLGVAAKFISRAPLVGNFIAFQAEAIRVTANTISQMNKELKNSNPKIRAIGAIRMAGIGFNTVGKAALVSSIGSYAGIGMQGLIGAFQDDEEEKDKQDAIRAFVWPWMKNDDLLVLEADNGRIRVLSLSSTDPHGIFNKSVNAMLYAEDTKGVVNELARQWGSAFLSPTIFFNYLGSVSGNSDNYGDPIYSKTDSTGEAIEKLFYFTMKTVGPTSFNSAYKAYESDTPLAKVAGQLSGMNEYDIDVAKQFSFKVADFSRVETGSKRIIKNDYRKDIKKGIDEEKAKDDANMKYQAQLSKLRKYYEFARGLGSDEKELNKKIKRLSGKERRFIKSGSSMPEINL